MYWEIDQLFKNKYKPMAKHFEKEIYQHVYISIAKFLGAPVLKNICERLLLKMSPWNWEKVTFINTEF